MCKGVAAPPSLTGVWDGQYGSWVECRISCRSPTRRHCLINDSALTHTHIHVCAHPDSRVRNESSPVNKGCKARAYRGGVSKQRRKRQQPRQLHGRGARAQPPGAAADAAAFTGVGGVGGSGRWRDPQKKKKKLLLAVLSPAPCSRCLGSLSNFRASRPSARPSVLVVGLFNPRLHALLLLVPVTAEADFHDASRSVCFCEFLRSKSDNLLPEEARPRLSRSLNTRTSSLYPPLSLSEHTHTLSGSLSLLPLSVEGRMFRMATLAWEFGRRRGCVYVCVKRKCRGWGVDLRVQGRGCPLQLG